MPLQTPNPSPADRFRAVVLAPSYRDYQLWCQEEGIPRTEALFVADETSTQGMDLTHMRCVVLEGFANEEVMRAMLVRGMKYELG